MSNYIKLISIKFIELILKSNNYIITDNITHNFISIYFFENNSDVYSINVDEVIDILKETSKTYRLYCNKIKDNTQLIIHLPKVSYKYSILIAEIKQDKKILQKLIYNKAIRLLVERNEELNQLVNKEVSKIF
jgi:hypothetical protein